MTAACCDRQEWKVVSEHILYISLSLKMQHMQRLKCLNPILQHDLQPHIYIFSTSQSQRMLIGLCRACSYRHETKAPTLKLTVHNAAVVVLPVLEK